MVNPKEHGLSQFLYNIFARIFHTGESMIYVSFIQFLKAHQQLDRAQIYPHFQEIGGVSMAETMNRQMFVDATRLTCRLCRHLHAASIQRAAGRDPLELSMAGPEEHR